MGPNNPAQTLATVGNALELVAGIVGEVVGGDVADSIQNQQLTRKVVYNHAQAVIGRELNGKLGN